MKTARPNGQDLVFCLIFIVLSFVVHGQKTDDSSVRIRVVSDIFANTRPNPILFNDPLGDAVRTSFRTGFLGIFGKKVTVTYDEKNGRWNNGEGSAYGGKVTKFASMVLNDLRTNQQNPLGNEIVTNLTTDDKVHNIRQGNPNGNTTNSPDIFYSGSSNNDNQKLFAGGKSGDSPSFVVLGHEMAHKFSQNLGIKITHGLGQVMTRGG